jgi:S1-C subfamily serine protease
MRRPPARRPRLVAGALIVAAAAGAATACADDGPGAAPVPPQVVAVAAQPCDRPLPSEGVGVVVGDGIVVTAGHIVEGPRRRVTVDGARATVVGVDRRTDLAVLRADVVGAVDVTRSPTGDVHVATPDDDIAVTVLRTGLLIVHDTTDRARYERQVHTIRPAVAAGTSGAPLLDASGDVAGIVVLANRGDGTSYAVTGAEVDAVLAANRATAAAAPPVERVRDAAPPCPG